MPENPLPVSTEPLIEAWLDVDGGVNRQNMPFLQDNELYAMVNGSIDRRGRRTPRNFCAEHGVTGFTASPNGFGLGLVGSQVCIDGGAGVFVKSAGVASSWAQWAGLSCATIGLWAPCLGKVGATDVMFLYSHSAISGSGRVNNTYNRISYKSVAGAATMVTIGARALVWWQGRNWAGGIDNGSGPGWDYNTLAWSDINDGGLFPSTQAIGIHPNDVDWITTLMPARSAESSLYIFKTNSIWRLDVAWSGGVYVPTTENALDTTNCRLALVSEDTGCVAPRTACYVGSGYDSDIFFLSAAGVQSLKRVEQDVAGGASEPISRPIQPAIDNINWNYAYKAAALVHDHKYFLAVPAYGSSDNFYVLVYDLLKKVWVGEYTWKVRDFAKQPEVGLLGSTGGRHRVTPFYMSIETNAAGYYNLIEFDIQSNSATPRTEANGTYMSFSEYTRPFHFSNFFLKKRWNWVEWIVGTPATNITLSLYAYVDDSTAGLLGHFALSPSSTYMKLPADAPWTAMAPILHSIKYDLTEVPHGHFIYFRLTSQNPVPVTVYTTRVSAWPMADIWTE